MTIKNVKMKNYISHIKLFLLRMLLLLAIFSISRVLFYAFNFRYFNSVKPWEFIWILIAGIRFDISALFYFNLIFIFFSIVPGGFKNNKLYQKVLFVFYFGVNALLLVTNFVDTKFFDFENKRLTSDVFSDVWLGEDFKTLLPQFIKDYWYLIILWICSCLFLYWFYPKLKQLRKYDKIVRLKEYLYQMIVFVLLLGLVAIGGRGGFQLKPLRVIHASSYTSARNVPLVLNTPFTIMKTLGAKSVSEKKYFIPEVLDSIYNPVNLYSDSLVVAKNKPNVVVLILESFSKEYIGAFNNGVGYTPFLDSLIAESLVFPNAFANGKRSIEAMTSIVAGIPSLQNTPYITSRYSSNTINALPEILNNKGYHTSFFHGGKNGTMNFDNFASMAGYSKYYGMIEFDNEEFFDGKWGIFDEEFLYFFRDRLSSFRQPFFSTIFTLTSHHPYPIPEKYKNRFPKGNLKVHETIGYTDYALKQFFSSIKNTNWYKNTLFVFVADHTAQAEKKEYNNNVGMYSIPIFFYHPTDSIFKGNLEKVAQQADIFPTIIDYIGCDKPIVCFGNSLLDDSGDHFAINFINGIFQIIKDEYVLQFDGQKTIAIYNYKKDVFLDKNLINTNFDYSELENKLKAIIQSYQTRMVHNKLSIK